MKALFKVIIAILLIYIGVKSLVPFHLYPIEHFEYELLSLLPISWKFVAVLSRLIIGFLFVIAFLLLFYSQKYNWLKYVSLFCLLIPFIVNTVYPSQLKDNTLYISEALSDQIYLENQSDTVILAYLSFNCLHCKEAALKLQAAQTRSSSFPKVIAVSYNNKIDSFFQEKHIDFPLVVIDPQEFTIITEASFPKFQLASGRSILKKWSPDKFNYAVIDNLSK